MRELSRRQFLNRGGSCAAHLALASALAPLAWRSLWAQPRGGVVAATEPFGHLERVADGIWALISTPLGGDRTTLSNGGLIAGRNGVVAVEGFMTPEGARWLAEKSRELTGQWPTHAVITHYHADHANGIAGYRTGGANPAVQVSEPTRSLVLEKNLPADEARTAALNGAELITGGDVRTIDLGGRVVTIVPRAGHTTSDVTIEVAEPSVVFTGDIVWNAMFPNYVDALPSRLANSVRALRRPDDAVYVPGHGAVATPADIDRYLAVLNEVEEKARRAHAAGTPPAEAGASFTLPASLGEWLLFNRVFFERAFAAWYRELEGGGAQG